jgi:hypothetical protein
LDDDGSGPILIESDRPHLDNAFGVDIVGLGCGKGCGQASSTDGDVHGGGGDALCECILRAFRSELLKCWPPFSSFLLSRWFVFFG